MRPQAAIAWAWTQSAGQPPDPEVQQGGAGDAGKGQDHQPSDGLVQPPACEKRHQHHRCVPLSCFTPYPALRLPSGPTLLQHCERAFFDPLTFHLAPDLPRRFLRQLIHFPALGLQGRRAVTGMNGRDRGDHLRQDRAALPRVGRAQGDATKHQGATQKDGQYPCVLHVSPPALATTRGGVSHRASCQRLRLLCITGPDSVAY